MDYSLFPPLIFICAFILGSGQGGRAGRITSSQHAPLTACEESDEKPSPRVGESTPHKSSSFSPRAGGASSTRDVSTILSPRRPAPPSVQAPSASRNVHRKVESATRPAERTGDSPKKLSSNPVQHALDLSQQALQALLLKTSALQSSIAGKIQKAERGGIRLIRKQNDFSAISNKGQSKALGMVDEREFQRPLTLLHQVTSFEDNAPISPHSRTRKGLSHDLRLMRSAAEKKTFDVQMHRLVQHRWFVAAMLKLRDYMKKMNNQVPVCCLKFIIVLQQVLLMDYAVSEAVFYAALEATVLPEDHLKSITHQLLRIVRRALGISDSAFLAYLEEKEISAHPELINQVKMMNKPLKKLSQTSAALTAMRASAFGLGLGLGRNGSPKVAFSVTDDETAEALTLTSTSEPSRPDASDVLRGPITPSSLLSKSSPLKPALRTESTFASTAASSVVTTTTHTSISTTALHSEHTGAELTGGTTRSGLLDVEPV